MNLALRELKSTLIAKSKQDGDFLLSCHAWCTAMGIPGFTNEPSADETCERCLEGSHLCRASAQGSLGLVRALIEVLEVPVDSRDRCGFTAFHCASRRGWEDVVQYLLSRGALVNAREGVYKMTPLHLATQNGHLGVVRLLVQLGAELDAGSMKNVSDLGPVTALQIAIDMGHLAICDFLLQHGADINLPDGNHKTPLMRAMVKMNAELVSLLLARGADPNIPKADGVTVMMAAAKAGNLEVVKLLVAHGAHVHRPGPNLDSPLILASHAGHSAVVEFLLQHGAKVNDRRHDDRFSSLTLASQEGHLATVELLLRYGADVSITNIMLATPLHLACLCGHLDIVGLLLSHGADINAKEEDGYTPLIEASMGGHLKVVKFLLQQKELDPGLRCARGLTPSQWAAGKGHIDIATYLRQAGLHNRKP